MESHSLNVCPICGKEALFYAQKNSCDLFRCAENGLIFVHPLPSDTSHLYGDDYFSGASRGFGYVDYDQDKAVMRKQFIGYLHKIEEIAGMKGKIMDVGAATGYFLGLAKDAGWTASGVEISDYAADLGRQRGLDIKTGTLVDMAGVGDLVDVITMWDVLEHLTDPRADLRVASSLLSAGGLLVINTPNSGSFISRLMGKHWHLLVPPEHLYYFTPGSLKQLLAETGFSVLSVSYPGKKFTLEYIAHTLARWQGLAIWKWLQSFFLKHPRLGQLGLPLNLRDNMLVYAQKYDH